MTTALKVPHSHYTPAVAPHCHRMQCVKRSKSTVSDGMQAQELRDAGKDPYAYNFDRTHMAAALHEQFASLENGHEAELGVRP